MAQYHGQINGPEQAHKVSSPQAWEQQAVAFGGASGTFSSLTDRSSEQLEAQISAGRWTVRCAYCENAPSASPEWQLAICYECGSSYAPTFPADQDRHDIEWLLMERPMRHRHWLPSQTVEDLQAENAAAELETEPPPYVPSEPVEPLEPAVPAQPMERPPIDEGAWPPTEEQMRLEAEQLEPGREMHGLEIEQKTEALP